MSNFKGRGAKRHHSPIDALCVTHSAVFVSRVHKSRESARERHNESIFVLTDEKNSNITSLRAFSNILFVVEFDGLDSPPSSRNFNFHSRVSFLTFPHKTIFHFFSVKFCGSSTHILERGCIFLVLKFSSLFLSDSDHTRTHTTVYSHCVQPRHHRLYIAPNVAIHQTISS